MLEFLNPKKDKKDDMAANNKKGADGAGTESKDQQETIEAQGSDASVAAGEDAADVEAAPQGDEGDFDAVELLKTQHREVEELFAQLEEVADKGSRQRDKLFEQLMIKLEAHAQIEERIFYPEALAFDEDQVREAYEEHAVVRDLLKKIGKITGKDETYKAKITVLKEIVKHHVEEEENELFPKVRKELDEDTLLELGEHMLEQFERIVEGGGRGVRRAPARAAATRKKKSKASSSRKASSGGGKKKKKTGGGGKKKKKSSSRRR